MAAQKSGRRKYVVIVCALALLVGAGLLGGRMAWLQYKGAQRQQIIATAPAVFDEGTQWGSDADSSFDKLKQRLVNSHPAYALGVAAIGVKDARDTANKLRCTGDNIIITATMATCQLPTGSLTAKGDYVLNFIPHPMPPTKFNAQNIPLESNGVPDLHPTGSPLAHYIGYSLSDTGPHYSEDANFLLKLLTNKQVSDIPYNGVWMPANGITMDARTCYASQQRNSLSVICFQEG